MCVCLQSLSRLTRVVPAVFLAVIDTCGSVAILECVGGAGPRVQQHLLTAMASALAASRIQTHRITQNRVCVCQKQIYRPSLHTKTQSKEKKRFSVIIYWYHYREIPQICV